MTDANYQMLEKLTAWAADRQRGMNELAHAWLLAQPSVCSVISGATGIEQIRANAKAADWVLCDDEVAEINTIGLHHCPTLKTEL